MFGTDLRRSVAEFIRRARRSPGDASDPALLEQLERASQQSYDGAFAALHAPIALFTWELEARLASGDTESARAHLPFPQPVEILGFHPVVIPDMAVPGALIAPTTDHIRIEWDTNLRDRYTSREGLSTAASQTEGAVTLSSLSVQAPRLIGLRLDCPNPQLGAKFSWKRGPGIYQDSIITLAVFCRWIPTAR